MSIKKRKQSSRSSKGSGQRPHARRSALPLSDESWQPRYDELLRTLFSGTQIEKRFVHPAEDQETVVKAFHEDGWPRVIDDPLPPKPGGNQRRRLRHTVGNLNRELLVGRIRFYTHNRCSAIRWKPVIGEE